MATLAFGGPWWLFALWTLGAFAAGLLYGSFFEWTLHRFVMHRPVGRILTWPWKLHGIQHHGMFGADHTYHAQDESMKEHVTFVFRDYAILLAINVPIFALVEWLTGWPVAIGLTAATFAYLQLFNSLHWRWHVPSDSWLQRTRLFSWMKERHRLHHARPDRNFNLIVPVADLLFGTYREGSP